MKKLLVALAVICMISVFAIGAFAYTDTAAQVVASHTINEDGSVTFTYIDGFSTSYVWSEIAIYDQAIDTTGKDMTDPGMPYNMALQRTQPKNPLCTVTRVVALPGTIEINGSNQPVGDATATYDTVYNWQEGTTYYVYHCMYNGDWHWSSTPYTFTYATEAPSGTADLSVIAYAAAAIVGCGALVIGKKRA